VRFTSAVLLLALVGCAIPSHPHAIVRPADLRSEKGGCAYRSNDTVGHGWVEVSACAMVGYPNTTFDSEEAHVMVWIRSWDRLTSDTGNWLLTVKDDEGRVLVDRIATKGSVPGPLFCSSSGCILLGGADAKLPPWRSGATYELLYEFTLDTRRNVRLSLTIAGGAPQPSAK
jgi:hypothetical protein